MHLRFGRHGDAFLRLALEHARRRGGVIAPALNGQAPTNVPEWVLRATVGYRFAAVPGLSAMATLSHEGRRNVLPDASVRLPSWTQVDAEGEAGARRVLDGARFVLIDAPRSDDQAQIERVAGQRLRELSLPTASINVMSPPVRLRAIHMDKEQAQRVFDYYVGGTRINHQRLFQYLQAILQGGDPSAIAPPLALPDGGIYHPGHDGLVFEQLPQYLAWWAARAGRPWQGLPVIGIEMSSSYISDGQQRMLDETVQAIEQAGALPLMFYRSSRVARAWREAAATGRPEAVGRPRWPSRALAFPIPGKSPPWP